MDKRGHAISFDGNENQRIYLVILYFACSLVHIHSICRYHFSSCYTNALCIIYEVAAAAAVEHICIQSQPIVISHILPVNSLTWRVCMVMVRKIWCMTKYTPMNFNGLLTSTTPIPFLNGCTLGVYSIQYNHHNNQPPTHPHILNSEHCSHYLIIWFVSFCGYNTM